MDEVRKLIKGSVKETSEVARNIAEKEILGIKSDQNENKAQDSEDSKQSDLCAEKINSHEAPAEVAAQVAGSAEKLDRGM